MYEPLQQFYSGTIKNNSLKYRPPPYNGQTNWICHRNNIFSTSKIRKTSYICTKSPREICEISIKTWTISYSALPYVKGIIPHHKGWLPTNEPAHAHAANENVWQTANKFVSRNQVCPLRLSLQHIWCFKHCMCSIALTYQYSYPLTVLSWRSWASQLEQQQNVAQGGKAISLSVCRRHRHENRQISRCRHVSNL